AAPQVGPAAADALAVQVAQHRAAAHALFVADDLAALADPRDEEGDLRQFFAGPAVTHHVLVAHDMALGVLQVFVRHRLGFDDRAAAGGEAEGENNCGSFDRFHISTFLVLSRASHEASGGGTVPSRGCGRKGNRPALYLLSTSSALTS